MRKVAYVIFFIVLVVAILVILGGSSPSVFTPPKQATESKVNVGFAVLNQSDEFVRVSFEDVAPGIRYLGINWEDSTSAGTADTTAENTHIQLIRGNNLDATGNASSWLFVVRQPEQVSLVTYDRYGEKVSAWPGKYPEQEISISQIITPRELFEKNRELIFPTPLAAGSDSRELALAEDTYYLTITGKETTRYLTFDAKTGALTPSND